MHGVLYYGERVYCTVGRGCGVLYYGERVYCTVERGCGVLWREGVVYCLYSKIIFPYLMCCTVE